MTPDELRQSIDTIVARASDQLGAELHALVGEALGRHRHEQEAAVASAVEQARRDASTAAGQRLAEVEQAASDERAARTSERESMLAGAERLLDGIRRIDAATSLSGTLDALADAVAAESVRSMVLVRRGAELRGWRLSGFGDAAPSVPLIGVPLAESGALRHAVERGEPTQFHPDAFGRDTAAVLAFAHLPESQVGLAVPVEVAGDTVALVYADDGESGERTVPGAWPETLEILARHASRRLEAVVALRAASAGPAARRPMVVDWPGHAGSEAAVPDHANHAEEPERAAEPQDIAAAQRYARLLVSEIRLYNEAAIVAGREARDLRARLRAEIDRARRMYEERVPASLPARDDYFEHELVQTLADGNPELLGDERHFFP